MKRTINLTKVWVYNYKLIKCSEKLGDIIEDLFDISLTSFKNIPRYKFLRHKLNSSREYKYFRLFVLTRDNYVCQLCNDAVATQVHHIIEVMENPRLSLDPTNAISLCKECHELQHPWL